MLATPLVSKLIKLAIQEDLAGGDITSDLSLSSASYSKAYFVARERLVVCGFPVLQMLIKELGSGLILGKLLAEGDTARKDEVIAMVRGKTKDILAFERTALNFLQRLSGIATATREAVSRVKKIRILDTRKTTPGLRTLEKYAVKVGGGRNHRMSLSDMILVKNNHVDARGSLSEVMRQILKRKPKKIPLEVEVRNMQELAEVLPFRPDIIMLDNMNDAAIKKAVKVIRKSSKGIKIEASGGITLRRLKTLDRTGIDYVSMGAITNRAQSVDISLRIVKEKAR